MANSENKIKNFINSLLLHPLIQRLKLVDDKGINVSTHTYDVLRIATRNIKKNDLADMGETELGLFAIVVGVIIHDTTKASLRLNNSKLSHSLVMRKHPEIAIKEARVLLDEVEEYTKLKIKKDVKEDIYHIVASHHGNWGKIKPQTREARIVHEADKYSAMYHRITPIGAKDIIKLMNDGFKKEEIEKITGYSQGIIINRLKRAKKQLRLRSTKQLLDYYRQNKTVPDGDDFFSRRIIETKKLLKKAEKFGFEKLVLENELLNYIYEEDVFE